jgi:predicted kinase
MGLHESANRSMFKALFLVGGPGSGKDVIIRESIAEKNAIEINANKAYDFIIDKQKLSEETKDYQLNAIRNRSALVINGASDDIEKISTIKEELEELGYTTMMVFVNTSNEVSENRNKQHSRVISEQIRLDKWNKSQDNLDKFYEMFNAFLEFDNSTDLQQSDILVKENKDLELSDISNEISYFFKTKVLNETAKDWLIVKGRLDINEDAKSLFKDNLKKKHMLKNNNAPITQVTRKAGKIDDVRDGDVASNSDYIFKTYEQSEPKLKINPQPKVKAFDTDKETKKSKRSPVNSTLRGKVINTPGVGDQYDTRTSGSVYPMSGLGDVTYRESFSKFRTKVKEAIDDPGATDMGTFGGMGNGVNKDPLITPADKFATSGPDTKKKKINKQTKVGFSIERKNTSGK